MRVHECASAKQDCVVGETTGLRLEAVRTKDYGRLATTRTAMNRVRKKVTTLFPFKEDSRVPGTLGGTIPGTQSFSIGVVLWGKPY